MTPPVWSDWLTESCFRVRIPAPAAEKLRQLPAATQLRLRHMLQEIAEAADLVPPSTARGWTASDSGSLLNLHLGRIVVRYGIDESTRTLTVAHVVVPADLVLDQAG